MVYVRIVIWVGSISKFINIILIVSSRKATVFICFVSHDCIVPGIKKIGQLSCFLPTYISIICYLCNAFLTAFGLNQNDAVGCACTINGRWGCIFQNRNIGNVVRVNVIDGSRKSVYQNQRIRTSSRKGSYTTNSYWGLVPSRTSGWLTNGDTTGETSQSLGSLSDGTVFNRFGSYACHRAGKIYFLLCTIAHYYYFIQCLSIFF